MMEVSEGATLAIEASASLRTFSRIGHNSIECLDGRARDLSPRDRCEVIAYAQLGLSSMSQAISRAAKTEPDDDWRKLLRVSAEVIDALHDMDELKVEVKAERLVGFSRSHSHAFGGTDSK